MIEAQRSPPPLPPPRWPVLIVDDEPEVHEVTRMLLSDVRFCGQPVELYSAYSAQAARAYLREHPETALILLDVVMETDDAGLHLIHAIRNDLGNKDAQIVLRTGQPGQAPERDVILNYDINGYFLKTEMTAQKLHSIVVSALRAYHYIQTLKHHAPPAHPEPPAPRLGLAAELRDAIASARLDLAIQPQLDLKNGRAVAIELLPSWQPTTTPPLAARELTLLADRLGLGARLGDWLIECACELMRGWLPSSPKQQPRISVDVSVGWLQTAAGVAHVERCLREAGLRPAQLELEFPEAVLALNSAAVENVLRRLSTLGINLVVDHFGVGSISLGQLKELRPRRLKIDASLIQRVIVDADSAAVTRAAIALAHTLDIEVVAEGITTKEQFEFLKWEECEAGQGDFIGKPLPGARLPELLRAYHMAGSNIIFH